MRSTHGATRLAVNPFPNRKVLVGVIHLPALPGAPSYRGAMSPIIEATQHDAEALARAGFDAVLVENFGDTPFFRDGVPSETVASMSVLADAARRASGLVLGINVLRNDGLAAIAVATAAQAKFVRINVLVGARLADQGIVQSDAARVLRLRDALRAADIAIVADVDVKHSVPLAPQPIDDEVRDARERAGADVIVVTGSRTGADADRDVVLAARHASPGPIWLGSGAKSDTAREWLTIVDGIIVGSALRKDGRAGGPIDEETARAFATATR
jgi:membrane complex biogenesis BtpA family protein